MSIVHLFRRNDSLATTADTTETMIGVDLSGQLYSKDSSGVKRVYSTGITPEEVQDIIGNTLVSSPSLTLTYDDAGNTISGTVVQTAIDHTQIQNRGTNTHAQIDTFITATATALNGKENTITFGTPSQYWRGDKTWQTLDSAAVGLGNVDNTSDLLKPISTATQMALNAKYDASNPNGYETPTQLNSRDAVNRARANHTGTQLANTISDFASAVRSSDLTGLTLTNSAITATDTVLSAFGKSQGQINAHFGIGGNTHPAATTSLAGFMSTADKIKLDGLISDVVLRQTTVLTNTSNTTFVTVSDLAIPVVAGTRYKFEFNILWDSNATATGLGISVGGTATGTLRSVVSMPISTTNGTSNEYHGPISAINGVVTGSATPSTGTQYLCTVEGVFTAATSGTIYPQFRSETNGTQVRVNIDSCAIYKGF